MVKEKRLKKLVLVVLALFVGTSISVVNAQKGKPQNEVTLVVSGNGATKDEATKMALRSAIEQSFGTFVSTNTQILNDVLVKDEIITVSSGNIKSFEYLSESELNGESYVMLKATVSIGKLISYAKSKGSSAEFAGQTFDMNIKMMNLRRDNVEKALSNMYEQVSLMLKDAFDYKIEMGEAQVGYNDYYIPITITVMSTAQSNQIYDLITNTLRNLQLSGRDIEQYKLVGQKYYSFAGLFPGRKQYSLNKEEADELDKKKNFFPCEFFIKENMEMKILTSLMNFQLEEIANPMKKTNWKFDERHGQSHIHEMLFKAPTGRDGLLIRYHMDSDNDYSYYYYATGGAEARFPSFRIDNFTLRSLDEVTELEIEEYCLRNKKQKRYSYGTYPYDWLDDNWRSKSAEAMQPIIDEIRNDNKKKYKEENGSIKKGKIKDIMVGRPIGQFCFNYHISKNAMANFKGLSVHCNPTSLWP